MPDEKIASSPAGLDDLRELARLFDEALDLPPEARTAWLAALPARGAQHARLAPRLARMLVAQASTDHDDALARGMRVQAPDDNAQRAGSIVGGYRLLDVLGQGGMGVVWLAEPVAAGLQRLVALKLPDVAVPRRALLLRFERERDILGALTHPHIARLYDAGVDPAGQPYLAMEVVSGAPITHWCDERRLGVDARLALFAQVLDAVRFAHAHLVIHRDLKPANILVDAQGRVHLLDFGIAKLLAQEPGAVDATSLTQLTGSALTPEYAAPELFLQEPVSTASDVYALGLLLHELLCGTRPYARPGLSRAAIEILALADERTPVSADVTEPAARARGTTRRGLGRRLRGDLDTIVLKAIQRQPAERYATVDALAQDLLRASRGDTLLARPASRRETLLRFVRRHRVPVALGATVAASLAIGLGIAVWQARIAGVEARTALATEAFLLSLFEANSVDGGDPVKAQQTTARQLLEAGSRRIATSMDDAPEAKLRVLSTLVRLNSNLSLNEAATTLQQQRLALIRQAHPGDNRELATALIDAASAALGSSSAVSQAPALLDAAQAMLDRLREPASPLRGRLEITRAGQLDADHCEALKHSRLGVPMLRAAPPSDDLFDGLMVMADNLSFCGDPHLALQAGEEALQVTRALGHRANIWQAHAVIAHAHATLVGHLGAAVTSGREALGAVRALHPANATPGSDELMAAAVLAGMLVSYGHADEALAAIGDLPERAVADIAHSDPDGVVAVLIERADALGQRGEGARAAAAARHATDLLSTYDAGDGQRKVAARALAAAEIEASNLPSARRALDRADALAEKLHMTGTSQVNEVQATRVRYWLRSGQPDRARDALARFVVKPSPTGVVTRPSIEQAIATADIALARHDWPAAVAAIERAQLALANYAEPLWARDLALRATLDEVEARTAVGPAVAAQAAAGKALALSQAIWGAQDGIGHCRTWRVLQRQAAAAGDAAGARALAVKIARWSN